MRPASLRLSASPSWLRSSVDRGDMAKQLKVLLPSSLQKLVSGKMIHAPAPPVIAPLPFSSADPSAALESFVQPISDELAGHLVDAGNKSGAGPGITQPTALVVNSFGKVWHVGVDRDGDGAFLGRGWPEFAAAQGFGVGWFLVLRHQGRGVLTVKAFDTTFCLPEIGLLPSAASRGNRHSTRKPQFINILLSCSMEKMLIPANFVQLHIPEVDQSSQTAVIVNPIGKFWRIGLDKNGLGVLLAGGWSQFLAVNGISEGEVVLLRYEGNMTFKIKVFGHNGCQKDFRDQGIRVEQNTEKQKEASSCSRKCKRKNEISSGKQNGRPKGSVTSLNKGSSQKKTKQSSYEIGPRSWIKKEISTSSIERYLCLGLTFCDSIGFVEHCTITLKTSMKSAKCWQVRALGYKKYRYLTGEAWKSFCQENGIREGDVCTFNVVERLLWHVVITRCSSSARTG